MPLTRSLSADGSGATTSSSPPGVGPTLLLGSLRELRRDPMEFYARIAREYGGFVRFFHGRKETFLAASPEAIKEVLVDRREAFVKNRRYRLLRKAIGNGLLHSEGDTWRRQRRATQDILNRAAIGRQVPEAAIQVTRELDGWRELATAGVAVDVEPRLIRLVQRLIGQWVLGVAFERWGDEFTDLVGAMRENWPKPPRSVWAHLMPPSLFKVRRLKKILARVDEVIYAAIRLQRESKAEDYSLLSGLARAGRGRGWAFDDESIRDQLLTLYYAGFETSASNLTFLFYELSRHPAVRERAYREVHEVLGDRAPRGEDLSALRYVGQSLSETLRLYPPAYNFTRVAVEDLTVQGYAIPEGAMVIISPWATHRLPDLYPDPLTFDPDRFRPEIACQRSQFAYIPFGAGHRFCVGAPLAESQTRLIAAMVMQRYRLALEPGYVARPEPGTVMRPADGMPMTIRPAEALPADRPVGDSGERAEIDSLHRLA